MWFSYFPAGISRDVPDKALIWMAAYDVPNPVCTSQHHWYHQELHKLHMPWAL